MLPLESVIEESADGFLVHCRIQPKASRTRICGLYNNALKVQVSAAPEKGKANAELCEFLAEVLHIAKSNVAVTKGELSRDKTVRIEGVTLEDLVTKLQPISKS